MKRFNIHKITKSIDLYVLLIFCAISLVLWWPTRYLPYHWDSAGFVINAAKNLIDTNFSPLIATNSDFSQPPLFIVLLAMVWKYIGNEPLIFHLFMLPFFPLLLFSTYKLFHKLHTNRTTAIITSLAVGSTAIVVSEYGQIYLDLPAASLGITALWLWAEGKPKIAITVLTAAVLTKISILILMPAFFLLSWQKKTRPLSYPTNLLLIPVIGITIFLAYHQLVTGWVFVKPGRPTITTANITDFLESIKFISSKLLISQNRWMVITPSIVGVIFFYNKKLAFKQLPYSLKVLLLQLGIGIVFFSWGGEFAERYGIFLLPLAYGVSFWIMQIIAREKSLTVWWSTILGLFVIVGLVSAWHPKQAESRQFSFRPPSDLTYQDMILVHRQASKYLETAHRNAIVYGSFPENIYLTQPYQHYVITPLSFKQCHQFEYQPEENQIIYIHPNSPGQVDCKLLFEKINTSFIQRYSHNQAWVEMYQVIDLKDQEGE